MYCIGNVIGLITIIIWTNLYEVVFIHALQHILLTSLIYFFGTLFIKFFSICCWDVWPWIIHLLSHLFSFQYDWVTKWWVWLLSPLNVDSKNTEAADNVASFLCQAAVSQRVCLMWRRRSLKAYIQSVRGACLGLCRWAHRQYWRVTGSSDLQIYYY